MTPEERRRLRELRDAANPTVCVLGDAIADPADSRFYYHAYAALPGLLDALDLASGLLAALDAERKHLRTATWDEDSACKEIVEGGCEGFDRLNDERCEAVVALRAALGKERP